MVVGDDGAFKSGKSRGEGLEELVDVAAVLGGGLDEHHVEFFGQLGSLFGGDLAAAEEDVSTASRPGRFCSPRASSEGCRLGDCGHQRPIV